MFTSPAFVRLRTFSRKLGLNRFLSRIIGSSHYEDRFGPALKSHIHPGDMVWDIGANVGLYTVEFLDSAGTSGHVVAFEPTSACFSQLTKRFAESPQVTLKNMAIGDADGKVSMAIEADALAATHRIVVGESPKSAGYVSVDVRSAASIVMEDPALFPNVVKIDVEGHEGAVFLGMEQLLSDVRLRCIGMEVHFGLLEERGESACPRHMEKMLVRHGYSVRWTDPSHLIALR